MAGVPSFISDGPWLGLFLFLLVVVFLRAQGTYWLGRWVRGRAETASQSSPDARSSRWVRRFSGPGMDKAGAFLDKWGFIGIPVSFLTIGFQSMVNASAGYSRMRWDLYTVAIVPGCVVWAILYGGLGLTIYSAFVAAPWLSLAVLLVLVALTFGLTRLRRSAGSAAHTPR